MNDLSVAEARKRLPYLTAAELKAELERANEAYLPFVEIELTRRATTKAASAAFWAAIAAGLTFAATAVQAIVAAISYISKL